ncbi:hypothetical protein DICVIV_05522 [Dictyocaulus viviparus]|uniref:Calcineurin-like phosphoesterase domain-containing protein n=1 Tax=Dictyocaulus viviparus TaxID=29172 RepID=A0A0D8XX62_DICVI|nr:hypothetical protein DICVIV_05522 [Dictyocaulus viviparus]
MGDTQYHYKCEPLNVACKRASKKCRESYGLDYYLRFGPLMNETARAGQKTCTKIESRYANRVQRQAMDRLINRMRYPPAALIINGDLTDFGHIEQYKEFQRGWLTSFNVPILAGLGNHDYENNVNDCALNFCAHTMLMWLTNYGKNMSLNLDYRRIVKSAFDITYDGSFAYSTRICSKTGRNCAQIIQLNNAIDYETKFSSLLIDWKVNSAMDFLKKELKLLKDVDIPILINMHQCEGTRLEKMRELISDWIYESRASYGRKRIAVFFAHLHSMHEVKKMCLHGVTVPFVYVGSVPNNRFSVLQISQNKNALIGFAARDVFDFGEEDYLHFLGEINDIWVDCTSNNHSFYSFTDIINKNAFETIQKTTIS